jgi:hypothetical protein
MPDPFQCRCSNTAKWFGAKAGRELVIAGRLKGAFKLVVEQDILAASDRP